MSYQAQNFDVQLRILSLLTRWQEMTTSKLVLGLVIMFGSCTWIGTNSVWMQLPLLTAELPEGWNLPGYLSAIVQIACLGTVIYTIVHKGCKSIEIPQTKLILCFLILACICQLGLVFLWKNTAVVGNRKFSVMLYLLLFGLALVDTMSTVLFMPFMAKFHPSYLNAYFVGMGFSSLIPSILAIIQGTLTYKCEGGVPHYSRPLFSTAVFFAIVFVSTCISTIAFIILSRMADKKEPIQEASESSRETQSETPEVLSSMEQIVSSSSRQLSTFSYALVLFTISVINAQMNGVIPSISSYASLPYSPSTYHYSVTLSNIMMPAASFLSFFVIFRRLSILMILSAMSTCATAFLIYLAALSPSLIFNSRSTGSTLSITASILAAGLHSYLRVSFASRLRACDRSESRLFWCGVFTQIGSFVGAMIMLPLLDIVHVFKSAPPCK